MLVHYLNESNKKNMVENYLDIINTHEFSDFILDSTLEEKMLCAFTAVELYDNPNLPEATPLMVVNKMYYFMLLDTDEVTDEIECGVCNGEGVVGCETCQGTGYETCDTCDGQGKVECDDCDGTGEDSEGDVCNTCDGTGEEECSKCDQGDIYCTNCHNSGEETCYKCDGSGKVNTDEYVTVSGLYYLTTDENLIKILKTRSKSKQSVSDLKIQYNPKTLYVRGSNVSTNIEISDIESIKEYSNDDFVANIKKVENLDDFNSVKLRNLSNIYRISQKYFED